MATILSVRGFTPKIGANCFLAPNSTIVGNVVMGDDVSIWFNTILRGDVHHIKIGNKTNIQDGTMIHGTYNKCGTTIGDGVTVGHNVILHGCEIGDRCLIGMGTTIMDKARVAPRCIVGAGSLITEESNFSEEGMLILGRPAKVVRPLKPNELAFLEQSEQNYILYKSWYTETSTGKDF
jgi:carbonic anhydrase/acetyltransferase-like protein (isoleucine patch superfamily)